jgi:hypothetical protein
MEDLSEKIRDGNSIVNKSKGKVRNISPSGARIEIDDAELAQKISKQHNISLNLNLKVDNPLHVAGKVIYIYKNTKNTFLLGLDFSGSKFGPRIKKVLPNQVKEFNKH